MIEDGGRARAAAALVALIAWGAIGAQLALNLGAAPADAMPLWLVPFRLYGYFTIWANTLVALVATHAARGGGRESVFARPVTLAATVVYIIVVGVIYNTLLAGLRHLDGTPKLIDTLLHVIVPIAYPLWWLAYVRRGQLGWGDALPAMAFPLAYCIVAMGRGLIFGKYAYFFIDVDKSGLVLVAVNIAALVAFFVGLMAALIGLDRWLARGRAATAAD